jgi:hypothetical protein
VVELDRRSQQPAHPDPEEPGYAPPDPASRSARWRVRNAIVLSPARHLLRAAKDRARRLLVR